jgi:SAM-dependent methyltransferase
MKPKWAKGSIKYSVRDYFASIESLRGKVVVDVPAGSGYLTSYLLSRGAEVHALDMFPELFDSGEAVCRHADLLEPLPLPDACADYVVCQEGIEHLPNQLKPLHEFHRILKQDGRLIITTPNISHIRAKLSNLLVESDLYNRLPPNELDAVWHSEDGQRLYFGHIFLIGVQRLRVLARLAGFRIRKILPVRLSGASVMLGFIYPMIVLANLWAYYRSTRRRSEVTPERKAEVYREITALNLNPTVIFGKHLFIELEKHHEPIVVTKDRSAIC